MSKALAIGLVYVVSVARGDRSSHGLYDFDSAALHSQAMRRVDSPLPAANATITIYSDDVDEDCQSIASKFYQQNKKSLYKMPVETFSSMPLRYKLNCSTDPSSCGQLGVLEYMNDSGDVLSIDERYTNVNDTMESFDIPSDWTLGLLAYPEQEEDNSNLLDAVWIENDLDDAPSAQELGVQVVEPLQAEAKQTSGRKPKASDYIRYVFMGAMVISAFGAALKQAKAAWMGLFEDVRPPVQAAHATAQQVQAALSRPSGVVL